MPLLSVLIFFPVLGGISLLFVERKIETVRLVALVVSLFELLFVLPIFFLFDICLHQIACMMSIQFSLDLTICFIIIKWKIKEIIK